MSHTRTVLTDTMISLAACAALAAGCAEPASETQEIIDNLQQAGFPADDIMVVDGKVFVGRDAEVSLEASREMVESAGPGKEQYRTTNLINPSLTKICVSAPTFTGALSTALDLAIQNYDELPLTFGMARAPSSGCSFTITAVIDPLLNGGVAGFPVAGLPFPTITIGSQSIQYGVDTLEHLITHELGHTIGFRHTDYYNRSISCGTGGNEGAAGIGAIHIPGTPTDASVGASVMNSCFRASETGEFPGNDIIALRALYGLPPPPPPPPAPMFSFRTHSSHYLVAEFGGNAYMASDRTAIGAWERFAYTDVNGGSLAHGDLINLRTADLSFWVAAGGGGGAVNTTSSTAGAFEAFRILNLDGWADFLTGDRVALQASNGQYVVAENGGGGGAGSVNANRSAIGPYETFVITLQ